MPFPLGEGVAASRSHRVGGEGPGIFPGSELSQAKYESQSYFRPERTNAMSIYHEPLTPAAAAAASGLSQSYLARLRQGGAKRRPGLPEGPRFRRVGRKVIYLRADIDAWLGSLSTSSMSTLPAETKHDRPTKAAQIALRQRGEVV